MTNAHTLLKRSGCVALMLALLLSFLPLNAFADDSMDTDAVSAEVAAAAAEVEDGSEADEAAEAVEAIEPAAAYTERATYADAGDQTETGTSGTDVEGTNDDESDEAGSVYALMNIPYSAFYNAVGVTNESFDYDAVTSATNKVGNYGKAGGGYHGTFATAEPDGEGGYTAVGGKNGAKIQGVIWPVKTTQDALDALGGTKVDDESSKVVATLGQGKTSSTTVVGYQTLMEKDAYSYYMLENAPSYYLELNSVTDDGPTFGTFVGDATSKEGAIATVSYGTNWGDVQLKMDNVVDASNAIINAVVVTAEDAAGNKTEAGFVLLNNVWSATDMAWKVAEIPNLDGKTISNITYYCSVKDSDTSDTEVPAYTNSVYSYDLSDVTISPVYTEEISAAFDFTSGTQITVTGLPANAENVKAKVYHTTGGRNAVYTYLTPLVVDPADDDIDPTTTDVTVSASESETDTKTGTISITPGSVTNNAGTTETYGTPIYNTEYTIELSSDNWVFNKIKVTNNYVDVLMNIPYKEFYAEEGYKAVDAVSAATESKATGTLALNSYYDEDDDPISILGVTYPVKVNESVLTTENGFTKVSDADVLRKAGSYAYVVQDSASFYKNLTVTDDAASFGEVIGANKSSVAANVTLTTGGDGRHPYYYELEVGNLDVDGKVCAVTLTTKGEDSTTVGLTHVNQIWRSSYLGFAANDERLGVLEGKTLDTIKFYLNDGTIFTIPGLDLYIPYNTYSTALSVAGAKNTAGTTAGTISGLPSDFVASYAVTKDGEAVKAISSKIGSGKVTLNWSGTIPQGTYTLTVSDKSGKYAPVTADFVLSTDEVYAAYDNDSKSLVAADGVSAEDFAAYLSAISSVNVDGTNYSASGRNSYVVVNQDGSLTTDTTKFDLSTGEHEITVSATGYADLTFTVTNTVTPDEPVPTVIFTDVADNAWYHDAVYAAAEKNLMVGVGNNKFDPNGTVTRSQVARIIWNMAGQPAVSGTTPFTDVSSNSWYTQAVVWAYQNGVVKGTSSTTFEPNATVTRQDFTVMLYRYAGSPATSTDLSKFSDAGSVSSYAKDAVQWAVSKGIIVGTNNGLLNPKGSLTRAEAATIMVRYAG